MMIGRFALGFLASTFAAAVVLPFPIQGQCSIEGAPALADADEEADPVDRVLLKGASSHPIKYYLSLPKNYRREPGKRWPVLICVDGNRSGFAVVLELFRQARGDASYLIVSPCTFSNTNAIAGGMLEHYRRYYSEEVIQSAEADRVGWDEAGLVAIIRDLQGQYGAEERVVIAGLSGGGHLTYRMIFAHPDLLAGAAPVCANFAPSDYKNGAAFPAERSSFPVHVILGADDPYRGNAARTIGDSFPEVAVIAVLAIAVGCVVWWKTRKIAWTAAAVGVPLLIMTVLLATLIVIGETQGLAGQNERALKTLRQLNYPDIRCSIIPGMGHEFAIDAVIDTFRAYLQPEK
jgi:pimeloyl-ACP methyl ester carboxylesterase